MSWIAKNFQEFIQTNMPASNLMKKYRQCIQYHVALKESLKNTINHLQDVNEQNVQAKIKREKQSVVVFVDTGIYI